MEIVKIKKKKRQKYKVNFDTDNVIHINENVLVKHNLYKGKMLSTEEMQQVTQDFEKQSILQAAIRLIQFRSRTAKELEVKLLEKGYSLESIRESTEKLQADGYINHEEYTKQFLHDALKLKRKGLKWARYELLQRGISNSMIDLAIDEMDTDFELEQLLPMAERKWNLYVQKYGFCFETKQRMKQFLERKGCTKVTINQIMKNLEI